MAGQQLVELVKKGDYCGCSAELLQNKDLDVNGVDASGYIPLMLAASAGHVEICELLLSHGAFINAKNDLEYTPLILAASEGQMDVCWLLVSHESNVNARTATGMTALLEASRNGHAALCKLLLDHGANVDDSDQNRWSALMWAAYNGHQSTCEVLLMNGCNPRLKNKNRKTAAQIASSEELQDCIVQFETSQTHHQPSDPHSDESNRMQTGKQEPATKKDGIVDEKKWDQDQLYRSQEQQLIEEATAAMNVVDALARPVTDGAGETQTLKFTERKALLQMANTIIQVSSDVKNLMGNAAVLSGDYPTIEERKVIHSIRSDPDKNLFYEATQGILNANFSATMAYVHGKFAMSEGTAAKCMKMLGSVSAIPGATAIGTVLGFYRKKKDQKQFHRLEALVASFDPRKIGILCEKLGRAITIKVYGKQKQPGMVGTLKEKVSDIWRRVDRTHTQHVAIRSAEAALTYIKEDHLTIEPAVNNKAYQDTQYDAIAEEISTIVAKKLNVDNDPVVEQPSVEAQEVNTIAPPNQNSIAASLPAEPICSSEDAMPQHLHSLHAEVEKLQLNSQNVEDMQRQLEQERKSRERLAQKVQKMEQKLGADEEVSGGGLQQALMSRNSDSMAGQSKGATKLNQLTHELQSTTETAAFAAEEVLLLREQLRTLERQLNGQSKGAGEKKTMK